LLDLGEIAFLAIYVRRFETNLREKALVVRFDASLRWQYD